MPLSDTQSILDAAIEQSEYAVVITTADLDPPGPAIEYVNAAFTRMTGYTREELLGATPRIHQGPATDRGVLDRLKAAARAGDPYLGSTWNYTRDGTPYLVEWTVTPVRLHGDDIDYYFSVQRDVTTLYQTRERLEGETRRLSALLESVPGTDRDEVTGALNRRGMLSQLQYCIDDESEARRLVGLVKLHLRRLDRIEQAFGAAAMHQLLRDIGERLNDQLEPGESLARSSENIFAVVSPAAVNSASNDADRHLMARACALVAALREGGFEIAGNAFRVEVGAGIARAPTDGRDAHQLAILAERAADTDTDAVRWPDDSTRGSQRHQLALEERLRRAVSERELVLFYQPIVELASGEVEGAEALARWPQPEGHAPIGPDQFIPLAEELGLMDRLGMQVLEDACRQLRRWQQNPGNEAFWVSVNVAPAQLRDPDLAEHFVAITQATGVSPSCVKLEITESSLGEQSLDEITVAIDALAAAGFPLALDDFGTGYSSLGRLIDMPFNVIKIDRSFVWQTPDGRGAGVVTSLSQLSSHLQLDALGEGVETAAHETFLRDCNYRYGQGFYYARPMAAADFAAWSGWPAD